MKTRKPGDQSRKAQSVRLRLPKRLYAKASEEAKAQGIGVDELILRAVAADLISAVSGSRHKTSRPLPVPKLMKIVDEALHTSDPAKAAKLEGQFVKGFAGRSSGARKHAT